VVALQVARVRGSLVDVSLRRLQLTLQLNDEDAAADEQQRVWPSRLHRQFVFEDRGIVPRQLIARRTSSTSSCSRGIEFDQARSCSGDASETKCLSLFRTSIEDASAKSGKSDSQPYPARDSDTVEV
jgi:hypothetical protein